MLVQIRLSPSTPRRACRNLIRSATPKVPTSESLFRDLENQLGASPREYLRLRLRYCHSAFVPSPAQDVALETRFETTATSTIRRKEAGSPWARGSEYGDEVEPGVDILAGVITRHWDAEKARRAVEMVVRSREVEREAERARERQRERLAYVGGSVRMPRRSPRRGADIGSRENVRMGNVGVTVPERRASLGKGSGGRDGKAGGVGVGGGSGEAPAKRDAGRWSWVWW